MELPQLPKGEQLLVRQLTHDVHVLCPVQLALMVQNLYWFALDDGFHSFSCSPQMPSSHLALDGCPHTTLRFCVD